MEKFNREFEGYKLFRDRELAKEFNALPPKEESDMVWSCPIMLKTLRSRVVLQYDDMLHVYISRKILGERAAMVLISISLISVLVDRFSMFSLIFLIASAFSFFISLVMINKIPGVVRSYKMVLALFDTEINKLSKLPD